MSEDEFSASQEFRMQKPQKARYTKTSMKKKEQLIEMVTLKNYSIYRASKKLKISNSTAKSIIKNFEKLGVILQRNSKSSMLKVMEQRQEHSSQPQEPVRQPEKEIIKQEDKEKEIIRVPEESKLSLQRSMTQYRSTYPFLEFPFSFFYRPFM